MVFSLKGAVVTSVTVSTLLLLSYYPPFSSVSAKPAPICPASLNCQGLPQEDLVVEAITTKPCVVFSKSYCPYCARAKAILNAHNADCYVVELDQHPDGMTIQQALAGMTGRRTVPNIFFAGEAVGGADSIMEWEASGKLPEMIKQIK